MAVKYTPEQEYAIKKRGADILVSAAAGSGKTAVLVERVLDRLTDPDAPVSIDRFLCLTFTEAAAAEMREKIYNRIADYAEAHPEDENISAQLKHMRKANISTIDSFVGSVVKSHYHLADIDPNYRIITGGEILQLKYRTVDALFEEKYAQADSDFFGLIEYFCRNTDDKELKDLVLEVHDFAASMPNPDKWLKDSVDAFGTGYSCELAETKWGKPIIKELKTNILFIEELLQRCCSICQNGGIMPAALDDAITHIKLFEKHAENGYEKLYTLCEDMPKLQNVTKKRDLGKLDDQMNILVFNMYKYAQKAYDDLVKYIQALPVGNWREDIAKLFPTVKALVALVREFTEKYTAAKREKRLAEFDDLAHFALNILLDENDAPTPVAQNYRQQFDEIIIDEYQDCSLIQDKILDVISGRYDGRPNRFMVGDIKQCIYKFRKANPEIFAEKYNTFSDNDKNTCLIQLNKNFRSRENILNTANFFFYQFMSKAFGDVDHTNEVALHYGADYSPADADKTAVEIAFINTTGIKDLPDMQDKIDPDSIAVSCEAIYTANRIKTILDDPSFTVEDTKTHIKRKAEPKDIVILLRKNKPIPIFTDTLKNAGIPVSSERTVSLFETLEAALAIAFIKIIDNPLQDKHLTAVLFSPLYGINANELVAVSDKKNTYLYESVLEYTEEHNDKTAEKLKVFLDDLQKFLRLSKLLTPLGEFMERLYRETGFYNYMYLLSAGEERCHNLDSLAKLAHEYDKTSPGDLYGFIKHLDDLSETDIGTDTLPAAETNSVTIMTMHKSKGLEFPIVFLPQQCAQFKHSSFSNNTKKKKIVPNDNIAMSQDLGIGLRLIDPKKRTAANNITNVCIERSKQNDELRESLRLFYVAVTRAREKLYIVGAAATQKIYEHALSYITYTQNFLPAGFMQNAPYCMEWILAALARSNRNPYLHLQNTALQYNTFINDFDFNCKFCSYNKDNIAELLCSDTAAAQQKAEIEALFKALDGYSPADDTTAEKLGWVYPYSHVAALPSKSSISEIKHRYYEQLQESGVLPKVTPEPPSAIYKRPCLTDENTAIDGAAKGTIYHTVMEHIDFSLRTYDDIENYKDQLVKTGILTENEISYVDNNKLYKFLNSDICARIDKAKAVYRERAFTLGLTPYELYRDEKFKNAHDLIHIDGIIDLYFEEEDGIVLLDYKTDYIENGNFKPIMDRYKIQLSLYADAITRAVNKPVKEKCLYLFSINEVKFY